MQGVVSSQMLGHFFKKALLFRMHIETRDHGFFKTPLFLTQHNLQNGVPLSFDVRDKETISFHLLKCSTVLFYVADTSYRLLYCLHWTCQRNRMCGGF